MIVKGELFMGGKPAGGRKRKGEDEGAIVIEVCFRYI
jgi:hypothetical protein